MLKQDVAALDAIFTDQMVWVHSNGGVNTRAEFLESVRTRESQWLRLDAGEIRVQVYDDVAIVSGFIEQMTTRPGRGPADRKLYVTEVYNRDREQWKLADFQAIRLF